MELRDSGLGKRGKKGGDKLSFKPEFMQFTFYNVMIC